MAKSKAEKNNDLIFAHEADQSPSEPVAKTKRGENYAKPDRKDGHPWGGTGKGNPSHRNMPPEAFCAARRAKDGKPCRQLKIRGAEVCGTHGGRAPQVMRKAMARLQNATDQLVQALLAIALDEEQPAPVRLAALRDALDRAGLKSSDKVELQHSMKQWESILTEVVRVPSERVEEEYAQRALDMNDDRY